MGGLLGFLNSVERHTGGILLGTTNILPTLCKGESASLSAKLLSEGLKLQNRDQREEAVQPMGGGCTPGNRPAGL